MVTMRRLPSSNITGPPLDPGPWNSGRAWLINRARGHMLYQRRVQEKPDVANMERIIALINESEVSNGVPTQGELTHCGLYHPDFGLHQIIVRRSQQDPSRVVLVAAIDWEAAQVMPRWALGRVPDIKGDISDDLLAHCHAAMLNDDLYRRAHVDGLQARNLCTLAQTADSPRPRVELLENFRQRKWTDTATMAG
ncbi:hypothetical protein CALVIDRAFT_56934 [Calocera viscosa TUFC12733]|uniref:Aminoglycoside phosphotransferase domain-containing protein n=1 Tax=Calocera viscosa (strain TUFC12733) TaxID=1330018 RepID=A0A167FIG3_CALVF|nr:hypothetical protein CALVIDRAFT_56934 [Calocera viscosa TUFC12733]